MEAAFLSVVAAPARQYRAARHPLTCAAAERTAVSRRAALLGAGLATLAFAQNAAAAPPNTLRAFFRYAPRVEKGRDLYVTEVLPLIEAADWPALREVAFVPTSDARKGSAKAEYGHDRKVSELQRSLYDPMGILGTSLSRKSADRYIDDLKDAANVIDLASQDKLNKLSKQQKKQYQEELAGGDRQQVALAAWENGRVAINEYIAKINDGLGRDVNKIVSIPDDFRENFSKAAKRPVPYGSF